MVKKTHLLPVTLSLAILAAGCSYSTQGTSGTRYLERYNELQYVKGDPATIATELDDSVREIAAIEPHLAFPARIGIARIQNGGLSTIPADEGQVWLDAAGTLGADYGEFVPVSPLIAEMVARPATQGGTRAAQIVATIRQGAARQHLDYVLVYEVGVSREDKSNILSLADLTVIGMFVIPSRSIDVEATASGILLDVRNGYPYATLTAHAEKNGLARVVSSSSTEREYVRTASGRAVAKLSDQFEAAMADLLKQAESNKGS